MKQGSLVESSDLGRRNAPETGLGRPARGGSRRLVCAVLAAALAGLTALAAAADQTVSDFDGLTNALMIANNAGGGVIKLNPGTYTMTGTMTNTFTTWPWTTVGGVGSHVYLAANVSLIGLGADRADVVLLADGTTNGVFCADNTTCRLENLMLTNCCVTTYGGAVYNGIVSNCVVCGTTRAPGDASTGVMTQSRCQDCEFSGNNCTRRMSIVYFSTDKTKLPSDCRRCTFKNNILTGGYSGVIETGNGDVVSDCLFVSNALVTSSHVPNVVYSNCVFCANGQGSGCDLFMCGRMESCAVIGSQMIGVAAWSGTRCLDDCFIGWNTNVSVHANYLFGPQSANQCLYVGNRYLQNGNFYDFFLKGSALTNCTVVDTLVTAKTNGAVFSAQISAENVIAAGNFVKDGVAADFPPYQFAPTTTVNHCLCSALPPGGYDINGDVPADGIFKANNACSADMGFVGGDYDPGAVMAEIVQLASEYRNWKDAAFFQKCPYSIKSKSPAVDKGDPSLDAAAKGKADFAGNRRLRGAHIDIGAFEAVPGAGFVISIR